MDTHDDLSQQHTGRSCPSEFALERLRLGEFDGEEIGRTTAAHVQGCLTCAGRMTELAAAPPPFPLDDVWRTARGRAGAVTGSIPTKEAPVRRFAFLRRFSLALSGAAALTVTAVASLLMLWPHAPPTTEANDLAKGGPWTLSAVVKPRGRGEVVRISSGARLSPGDRLRFEVSTSWSVGYVAIVSLDARGAVSPMIPAGDHAMEVKRGRPVLLDGATELDQTVGTERIELLACRTPMSVAKVVEDARRELARAGGDLNRVGTIEPGCDQETLWIEKVRP